MRLLLPCLVLLALLRCPAPARGIQICSAYASCDLQALVNKGGSVIIVGDILLSSTIIISSPVALQGSHSSSASIYGTNSFRLFDVRSNLTLADLSLNSGASLDGLGGGAILLDSGARLDASNVSFMENRATAGDGGALAGSDNSSMYLSKCTFQFNSAAAGDGGALTSRGTLLYMDQCSFLNNAAFFSGGAVKTTQTVFAASNCLFVQNSAQRGGAFASWGSTNSLIYQTLFDTNAAIYGGAVHDFDNVLAIVASNFSGNVADDASSQAIFCQRSPNPGFVAQTLVSGSWFAPDVPATRYVNQLDASGLSFLQSCSSAFPGLPVLGCGDGATCLPGAVGVKCACGLAAGGAANASSNKPVVCGGGTYRAVAASARQCATSGGYVPDQTPCVFPFTVSYTVGKTVQRIVYNDCQPVRAGMPYESVAPRPGTANGYWCATAAKYSPEDTASRKAWGFCGVNCGYLDAQNATTTPAPSPAPSAPSASPSALATAAPTVPPVGSAPVLALARYSDGGSRIEVYFDRDTNCGGNCSTDTAPCTRFLAMVTSAADACRWTSPSVLYISPSLPYANVTLAPGVVAGPAGGPPFSQGSQPVVGGGAILGAPIVVLVAPSEITRCASDRLVIDGSTSRVTTIGGVQSLLWELKSVEPLNVDVSGIRQVLSLCTAAKALFCSTGELTYPGQRFVFALTLTNAFNVAAVGSLTMEVLDVLGADDPTPLDVSFATGSSTTAPLKSSTAADPTRLEAKIRVLGCGAAVQYTQNPITVVWSIPNPAWAGTSKALIPTSDPWVMNFDPSKLSMGPRTALPVDVTVRLTATLRNFTASATLLVHVVETPLVPTIANANCTVPASAKLPLVLLGQVASGARLAQEALFYQWSCTVVRGAPGETVCPLRASLQALASPLNASAALAVTLPGRRYNLRLDVFSTQRPGRVASAVAYIATADAGSQPVLVLPSPAASYYLADQRLRALGGCASSQLPTWAMTEQGFQTDVSNVLTPLPAGVVAPKSALVLGGQYLLRVTCTQLASSDTLVAINAPPRGGDVAVTPSEGSVTDVTFVLRTDSWVDEEANLPFSFVFAWLDVNGIEYQLAPLSSWASRETLLPLGATAVVAHAVDSLGAVSLPSAAFALTMDLPDNANNWFVQYLPRWVADAQFVTRSGSLTLAEVAVGASIFDFVDASDAVLQELAFGLAAAAVNSLDAMVIEAASFETFTSAVAGFPVDWLLGLDARSRARLLAQVNRAPGVPQAALFIVATLLDQSAMPTWTSSCSSSNNSSAGNGNSSAGGSTVDDGGLAVLVRSLYRVSGGCASSSRRALAAAAPTAAPVVAVQLANSGVDALDTIAQALMRESLAGEATFSVALGAAWLGARHVSPGLGLAAPGKGQSLVLHALQPMEGALWLAMGLPQQAAASPGSGALALSDTWTLGGDAAAQGFVLQGVPLALAALPGANGTAGARTTNGTLWGRLACVSFAGRSCNASLQTSATASCACGAADTAGAFGAAAQGDRVLIVLQDPFSGDGEPAQTEAPAPGANRGSTSAPTKSVVGFGGPAAASSAAAQQGWAVVLILLVACLAVGLLALAASWRDVRDAARRHRALAVWAVWRRARDRALLRFALARMRAVVAEDLELCLVAGLGVASAPAASAPERKRGWGGMTLGAAFWRVWMRRHAWLAPFAAFDPHSARAGRTLVLFTVVMANAGGSAGFQMAGLGAWWAAALCSAVCAGPLVAVLDGLFSFAAAGGCACRGRSVRQPHKREGPEQDVFALQDARGEAQRAGVSWSGARQPRARDATHASAARLPWTSARSGGTGMPRTTRLASKLPLVALGGAGAGIAVAWNLSAAGEGLILVWLESFALALAVDVALVQSVLAALRVAASVCARRGLGKRRGRKDWSAGGPEEAVARAGPRLEWGPRFRSRSEEDGQDDDGESNSLMGVLLEVESLESDKEARDLVRLILGSGLAGGGAAGADAERGSSDVRLPLERHYQVPGDTDSSQDGGASLGEFSRRGTSTESPFAAVPLDYMDDHPGLATWVNEQHHEKIVSEFGV